MAAALRGKVLWDCNRNWKTSRKYSIQFLFQALVLHAHLARFDRIEFYTSGVLIGDKFSNWASIEDLYLPDPDAKGGLFISQHFIQFLGVPPNMLDDVNRSIESFLAMRHEARRLHVVDEPAS